MRYITLLFCALPLLASAPSNSITITNSTGSAQSGYPVSILRVFARGEITDYAQPSGATTWQNDVRTRWDDGSLQQVQVSWIVPTLATGATTVTFSNSANQCSSGDAAACNAAALDGTGALAFNSGAWGASISTTASTIAKSASARTMVGNGDFRYWLRGPAVTQIIAEDRTTARAYDFGYTCASNCTGTYSTATWTSDTTNKSLHPIFVLTMFSGWAGVKEEFILENDWYTALQDQRYDLTLKSDSSLSTTKFSLSGMPHYARTRWRKTFWDGTAPATVKIDLNLTYLTYSKAIPTFDTSKSPSGSDISAEVTYYGQYVESGKEPIVCSATGIAAQRCGSVAAYMPTTGGRPDIGLYPRWDVRYLYSFDTSLRDAIIANGEIGGLVPIHYRESGAGWFDDGHTVSATGRVASIDTHSTYRSFPAYMNGPTTIGTLSSSHGWTVDMQHTPNLAFVPYLITGDYFFLEELQHWGAFVAAASPVGPNDTYYSRHDSWGIIYEQAARGEAWSIRFLFEAGWASPDSTPEKTYFTQKSNFNIAVREGEYKVLDGAYVSSCNAATYDPTTTTDKYCWGRFTRGQNSDNPYRVIDHNPLQDNTSVASSDTITVWAPWQSNLMRIVYGEALDKGFAVAPMLSEMSKSIIPVTQDPTSSPYYAGQYYAPTRLNPGVGQYPTLTGSIGTGTLSFSISSAPAWLPATYPAVMYLVSPSDVASTLDAPAHYGSFFGGNVEVVRVCDITGTIVDVCGTGRGLQATDFGGAQAWPSGTVLVYFPWAQDLATMISKSLSVPVSWNSATDADFGYDQIAQGAAAFVWGYTALGYAGRDNWNTLHSGVGNPSSVLDHNPKFAFIPRFDPTSGVSVSDIGATSATISYTKPTVADACTVDGVSDGITNSREVTVAKTGLSAGTTYNSVIHCALDPYNSGNTTATFTTIGAKITTRGGPSGLRGVVVSR